MSKTNQATVQFENVYQIMGEDVMEIIIKKPRVRDLVEMGKHRDNDIEGAAALIASCAGIPLKTVLDFYPEDLQACQEALEGLMPGKSEKVETA